MRAAAYRAGVKQAFEAFAKQGAAGAENDKPSWLSKWWPLLAGAGVGAGAYGLMRIPFKADPKRYPALRKIQDAAKGNMLRADIAGAGGKKGWLEKVKRAIIYGPEVGDKIPKGVRGTAKSPTAIWSGFNAKPPRGTFDPALGLGTKRHTAASTYRSQLLLENKLRQAKLLEKFAPNTTARTRSLQDLKDKYKLKLRPERLKEDLPRLQEALKTEFGKRKYIIKTRSARPHGDPMVQSRLKTYPTNETDLMAAHEKWKGMRGEFHKLMKTDPNVAVKKFRNQPGYEGRVVEEALHDNVVFQERLPIQRHSGGTAKYMRAHDAAPTKEYRVHTVGGYADPGLAAPRFYPGAVSAVPEMFHARRAAKWIQKEVLDKLPAKYRNMTMGIDVAPVGRGKFKVIELNPGGQSGVLDTPGMNLRLHKTVTGRYPHSTAALVGAGSGIAASGASAGAQALLQSPSKKEKGTKKAAAADLTAKEKREQEEGPGGFSTSLVGFGAGLGAAVGTSMLARGSHALDKSITAEGDLGAKLQRPLRKHMDVPKNVRVSASSSTGDLGSFFDPERNRIGVGRQSVPSSLAHELGHASGWRVPHKLYGASLRLGNLAALASIPAQAIAGRDSAVQPYLRYAPAALLSPVLVEEARASLRALRGLHAVKGWGGVGHGLLSLLPSFGTYAGLAATPIVAGEVMDAYRK